MTAPRLRPSVRALVVDDTQVLLCRFDLPDVTVWATPGGGVEPGESQLQALRRELDEEVGLVLDADPPHVWHQVVVAPEHAPGFDGIVNDIYLVHTTAFTPGPSFTTEQLLAENLGELRWWTLGEIVAYDGPAVFAPRDLGRLLGDLFATGPPATPLELGL